MGMEMTFGEKLRLLREEKELTQRQLGQELNMTQRKISYLENGRYEPGMEDIRLFCEFFQVSADFLLGFPRPLPFPKRGSRKNRSF